MRCVPVINWSWNRQWMVKPIETENRIMHSNETAERENLKQIVSDKFKTNQGDENGTASKQCK